MIRLKDIAQVAGVSVMTVSRVLRDDRRDSSATKARVRGLAARMGYVPNATAQGLRTRSTRLLGVIFPAPEEIVASRILAALADQGYELGYDILVQASGLQAEREETCIRRLMARRVEGILILPIPRMNPTAAAYEELRRSGTKVVIIGHKAPFCRNFPGVETDDLQGSYQLARHLLELGHRRIAFFKGPAASATAAERFEGYRRALREAGIEIDDHLIFHAGSTQEDGAKAGLQLLGEQAEVTAIQSVNDLVAIGAAEVLSQQGFRIPQDISVAGFGNHPASALYKVPLTTVSQPKFRLGIAAAEVMVRLLRGEKVADRRLPAELAVRASSGSVRQLRIIRASGTPPPPAPGTLGHGLNPTPPTAP